MACEFNDELTKRIQEELGHKGGENARSRNFSVGIERSRRKAHGNTSCLTDRGIGFKSDSGFLDSWLRYPYHSCLSCHSSVPSGFNPKFNPGVTNILAWASLS
jgi:hypothetical protein